MEKLSQPMEDYLKTIYLLQERSGKGVSTTAIAQALSVTPASVTGMVKKLAEMKLARHARYQGVELTCSGRPSDPRLVGQYRNSLDVVEAADESATLTGTFSIDGEAGSWSGRWTGTVDAGYTTHRIQGLLLGSGAYAGLRWAISVIATETGGYVATGVIEPAP